MGSIFEFDQQRIFSGPDGLPRAPWRPLNKMHRQQHGNYPAKRLSIENNSLYSLFIEQKKKSAGYKLHIKGLEDVETVLGCYDDTRLHKLRRSNHHHSKLYLLIPCYAAISVTRSPRLFCHPAFELTRNLRMPLHHNMLLPSVEEHQLFRAPQVRTTGIFDRHVPDRNAVVQRRRGERRSVGGVPANRLAKEYGTQAHRHKTGKRFSYSGNYKMIYKYLSFETYISCLEICIYQTVGTDQEIKN
eukprot:284815904_4